jgi:peptide deformylase
MIRTILHYPDPRLREKAQPVARSPPRSEADRRHGRDHVRGARRRPRRDADRRAPPHLHHRHRREDEPSDLRVFINPEIIEKSGEEVGPEGCLSFPGITEDIKRAAQVTVRAEDRDGKPFELEADGLLAVADPARARSPRRRADDRPHGDAEEAHRPAKDAETGAARVLRSSHADIRLEERAPRHLGAVCFVRSSAGLGSVDGMRRSRGRRRSGVWLSGPAHTGWELLRLDRDHHLRRRERRRARHAGQRPPRCRGSVPGE